MLPRELENLCRFLPGVVSQSQSSTHRGQTLFVLFDTQENAHFGISQLNGQLFDRRENAAEPMRAQMAKSNMRSAGEKGAQPTGATYGPSPWGKGKGGSTGPIWGGGAPANQPPPPTTPPPPGHPGTGIAAPNGAKRPRIWEDPGQVDTVASVGAAEAGWAEDALRAWFEACPGFIDFKPNPRMSGGFAKFSSPQHAMDVVQSASEEGIPAEMAKSSMSTTSNAGGAPIVPVRKSTAYVDDGWQGSWGPPSAGGAYRNGGAATPTSAAPAPKRPRIPEDPNQVDTVASIGAADAGWDESSLRLLFESLEGFIAFKGNSRIGGGFAKFASHTFANVAVQSAKEQGVPCEIARSSMSVAA